LFTRKAQEGTIITDNTHKFAPPQSIDCLLHALGQRPAFFGVFN